MASVTISNYTYNISQFSIGGESLPIIIVKFDAGQHVGYRDTITITDWYTLALQIHGLVSICGTFADTQNAPQEILPNFDAFIDNSNNMVRVHVSSSSGGRPAWGNYWFYTSTNIQYNYNDHWYGMSAGRNPNGGYGDQYKYMASPLLLLYNTFDNKYLVSDTQSFMGLNYNSPVPLSVYYSSEHNVAIPFFQVAGAFDELHSTGNTVGIMDSVSIPDNVFVPVIEDRDPYAEGGISTTGGGEGTFDFTSDDIPIPNLPSLDISNAGFIRMYKPSLTDLTALGNYLWAGTFDPANFKKLFADPMDAIIGLHIIPTDGVHPSSTAWELKVGNISTGLSIPSCVEQYFEVDCGRLDIDPKWGAYLDYSPYTKLQLYLPYIGFVSLSADDCMDGSISVKYHIDALSGSCLVFVYCSSNHGEDDHVLYQYSGQCSCECPITSGQYANLLKALPSFIGGTSSVAMGVANGSAGGVIGGISDASNAIMSTIKPEISRSGSYSGSAGLMGIQTPYLIMTVPKLCTAENQNHLIGYPSYITLTLGDIHGYTQIDTIHLAGIPASQEEQDEIESLLKEGVYL